MLSIAHAEALYRLLQVTDEVFTACGITYWADSGTLLGAVRNKGIIPTDDDVDLAILHTDVPLLLSKAKNLLEKRGYTIADFGFGYKVLALKDLKPLSSRPDQWQHPRIGIDVFPFHEKKKGVWVHANPRGYKKWGDMCFKTPLLFPLRRVPFGPTSIIIPYDPHPYLDDAYPGWNTTFFVSKHGFSDAGFQSFSVPLTHALRQPAPWRKKAWEEGLTLSAEGL